MNEKGYFLSAAEAQRIHDLRDSGMAMGEIAETVGRSAGTVSRCLNDRGGEQRMRICPKCGAKVPAEGKFCMMCGAQMLTKNQLAGVNLLKVRNESIKFLPESMRNAADEAMMEAVKILQEGM